jgi:hypothetical protein
MAAGIKTGGRVKGTPNKPKDVACVTTPVAAGAAAAGGGGAQAEEFLPTIKTRARQPFPPYKLAPVDKLIPYANNARTHTPAQVAKIAASIREFGFTNPVLIDARRGIVAGHGRVLAARMLAMDRVPVIELGHLTAAQRRAYIIADNRLALDAGWDSELLELELTELRDMDFDLALTGFDGHQLETLFNDPEEPKIKITEEKTAICPGCGHRFAL